MSGTSTLELISGTAISVLVAIVPLAFLFLVFQIFFLRLPVSEVSRILTGTLIAGVGLFLFLLGALGLLAGALFSWIIVAQWIAIVALDPCPL